jgi:hypothetical protein
LRKRPVLFLITLLIAGTVLATSELVLRDGRIISGVEVRREGDEFHVEMEGGNTIVIPSALVAETRLIETEPPPAYNPVTGLSTREDENSRSFGQPTPPEAPAIKTGEPQELGNVPAMRPPTTSEQLAAFGRQGNQFQQGTIDPYWRPESDWEMDPEKTNNFAPSEWAEAPIDPDWVPESDWDMDPTAKNEFAPSEWAKSTIDNEWVPTDGFAR